MFCSDEARRLCPDRECCGTDVRGDFQADSWCGGFNAGVAAAAADTGGDAALGAALRTAAAALVRMIRDETRVEDCGGEIPRKIGY